MIVGRAGMVCDRRGVDAPDPYAALLEEYEEHLALERGRSEHTRRAYLGDLRSLFAHLDERAPGAGLAAMSLPVLRGWLAAQATAGAARTTLARRTSAVKTFTAWATRRGLLPTDPAALRAALRPGRTKLVWIETPANPLWSVTDIADAAAAAHAAGALLAVDSTVATPVLTRPLALGADVVMHAATKYLNGHSDVVAGVLVTRADSEYWQRVRKVRAQVGGTLGSFEAWLLLRGLRTLPLRVRAACAAAQRIAEHFAADHPHVLEVLYPGLPGFPGHDVARRQMEGGFGGMLSLRVRGGEAAAIATAAHVGLWKRATSLGGTESLIEHRASVEGPGTPAPPDLLRLSVGLEHVDDLIEDLARALEKARPA